MDIIFFHHAVYLLSVVLSHCSRRSSASLKPKRCIGHGQGGGHVMVSVNEEGEDSFD